MHGVNLQRLVVASTAYRTFSAVPALDATNVPSHIAPMTDALIDDFSTPHPLASNGAQWSYVADTVMGGVSRGTLTRQTVEGRQAARLRGQVSLENNGGFVQMALDIPFGSGPSAQPQGASGFTGIALEAIGNGETYNVHLRTSDVTRPWQSYRQSFISGPSWETHRIAFTDFEPHRIDAALDVSKLRRLGILGIGRVFEVDVSIADIRFY